MAPEQMVADSVLNGRCDIFALGAGAYFVLRGRPPFETRGGRAILMHTREAVAPPSVHRPGLPVVLEAVVDAAWRKTQRTGFRTRSL